MKINFKTARICATCHGRGTIDPPCDSCDGTGRVDYGLNGGVMDCPDCESQRCDVCDGTGKVDSKIKGRYGR